MRHSDPLQQLPTGHIVITPKAQQSLPLHEIVRALRRHAHGGHGDFQDPARGHTRSSTLQGCRRLSAFRANDGTRFWILSEADEPLTTVLLPEDY